MSCLSSAGRVGVRIEGNGPPIVLLHSSMSSKNQWSELIESLRGGFRRFGRRSAATSGRAR